MKLIGDGLNVVLFAVAIGIVLFGFSLFFKSCGGSGIYMCKDGSVVAAGEAHGPNRVIITEEAYRDACSE